MYSFGNISRTLVAACVLGFATGNSFPAHALSNDALAAAVASSASLSDAARSFYKARDYQPIWMGEANTARANALVAALEGAGDHGLPVRRYTLDALRDALAVGRSDPSVAAEAEMFATRIFLSYARDLSSGALEPSKIDREIAVRPPRREETALLTAFSKSSPTAFFKALAPQHDHYKKLMAEKKRLEAEVANDTTPSLGNRTLQRGSKGPEVVALRARLAQLGYGDLGTSEVFDKELRAAVRQFQKDRGLGADGIVGPGTRRAFGGNAADKLKKVIVNLERERWLNRDRGKRHIIVNIADFSFTLYEDDKPAFYSVTVVGKRNKDRTPEFHDEMTHMVVNPTWHVPPSIAGKEYLPTLKRRGGLRGLRVIGRSGRAVDTASVDWSKYSAKNFPYSIKQPPGPRNALGRVKFMFPNRFNIYLHDTPSKNLFKREVRAFSHGCVRVQRPFEFAHKLLEAQTADPKGAFESWLKTGREQYVNLQTPVPVYLTYKTAFVANDGTIGYRGDIYGRDAKLWRALTDAGVETVGLDS